MSGFAGVRPLVSARGIKDTKKLIRDDEVEFDPESGMISPAKPKKQQAQRPPSVARKTQLFRQVERE